MKIPIVEDLGYLLFPHYCPGCGESMNAGEQTICTKCLSQLPKTFFSNEKDNRIEKLFWGRIEIEAAAAFLRFSQDGLVQRLLHALKYYEVPEIGEKLGRLFGKELSETPRMHDIDAVMPIPLHPRKLKLRGYNQSLSIAQGISDTLGIPVEQSLIRVKNNDTQTRKSKYARWENVSTVFGVTSPEKLENQHILLIDDVITTGSTIEAAAQSLKQISGTKITIGALAFPMN